jgi:hypothetical protein
MADLVKEIATFLRRAKGPVEQALEEVGRRWPEATGAQLELATRAAIAQLHEDTRILRDLADLWIASAETMKRRAGEDPGGR